jgi:hypothetical protein
MRTMIMRLLLAIMAASALILAAIGSFAGPAHADPTCQTDPFGPFGSQRRTLCDGPILNDGSWSRERTIWVPGHEQWPICTSQQSFCPTPYWVKETMISDQTYPVSPDTVLPDEPGHVG